MGKSIVTRSVSIDVTVRDQYSNQFYWNCSTFENWHHTDSNCRHTELPKYALKGTAIQKIHFMYTICYLASRLIWITLKCHRFFKNPHAQPRLNEGSTLEKSGIPVFQNNGQTDDFSGKRLWYSWSAQNFDSRNVNKPRGGGGHLNFVTQFNH